ncbi:CPBP family intramembrane metalloprotease [Cyanobium sp. HWJ4-Hawea]|uniref:CPBP family intramembrane glutamic endopeptidase n=1 Tax=Cyanobium sp. HWJ4-Hawea TaxID=2823713 RepID=UPI0020CC50A0|nr:type II CAAX endopeptidase family protein [Cyanobium sp. HWJ4-Hawea]MCP9809510.1 CPBP family intramembrane metalloprotease [Cyanobium sp. HWJ4-Hawea]
MAPLAANGPKWPGTLLYVPVLYGLGWLGARPCALLFPHWRPDQVDLAGLVLSLALLLISLPIRLRRVWGAEHPWQGLGLAMPIHLAAKAWLRGALKGLFLLALVVLVLVLAGQARWLGELNTALLLNAIALMLGVGFAEELLFRGWLWGELELELGPNRALWLQAAIFALLHPWYRAPGLEAIGLLGGLTLLGLALALQRRADDGALWGSIGLHGWLVGGWFLAQKGLLQISPAAPGWWVGPGGADINPIGGLIGWIGLGLLLWVRRRWWPRHLSQKPETAELSLVISEDNNGPGANPPT